MILKHFTLFLLLFLVLISNGHPTNVAPVLTSNNYGAYVLNVEEFTTCSGPKQRNLTSLSLNTIENNVIVINQTFLYDAKLKEIKISVFNMKGEKSEPLYNYKLQDPCKHFMLAQVIKRQLNAENCFVKAGFYETRFNLVDFIRNFFGNTFFYGTYFCKAVILSKAGNIACFTSKMVFSKK